MAISLTASAVTMLHKNYKEIPAKSIMEKRGQVAIFIIVAIIIVVGGVLAYFFVPQVRTVISGELSPNAFVKDSLSDKVLVTMELLSSQGGYLDPEGYLTYQGNNVKYLCYNAQFMKLCAVQQPMIKAHYEQELETALNTKAKETISLLISEYESRGYTVTGVSDPTVDVEITLGKIIIKVDAPMTVTKESTESLREFTFEIPSKIYTLLMTATSIIDFESTYGDSETSLYIRNYPDLTMDKIKLGDGSTVYTVGDVITGEKFTFASRSLAWPAGYGVEK